MEVEREIREEEFREAPCPFFQTFHLRGRENSLKLFNSSFSEEVPNLAVQNFINPQCPR